MSAPTPSNLDGSQVLQAAFDDATGALRVEGGGGGGGGNVNLTQIDGTATSTGTGVADAGTQRVAVSSDSFPAVQAVSATALPLPTGAATSANQSTEISSLAIIATNTTNAGTPVVSGTVTANAGTGTFAVSAASLPLPTGAATSANQSTMQTTLSTIATNTTGGASAALQSGFTDNVSLTGSQSATVSTVGMSSVLLNISGTWTGSFNFQQSIDGVNFFPISGVDINVLNNQAPVSTSANGSFAFNVAGATIFRLQNGSTITGTAVVQLGSSPNPSVSNATLATTFVAQSGTWNVSATTTMPDSYVSGAATQTAVVNNILTTSSGTASTDLSGFHTAAVQVVSTGTAGTFIFEGSNDNVNFQTIPVYNQLIITGTPITAAITASVSQPIYTFPVNVRYVRLRIATTITGGSIQAFSRFSQEAWTPAVYQVTQASAANLATTATIASGTVTTVSTVSSVTSSQEAIPGIVADVASAAIISTTTTATITPTFGLAYQVNIPVTVVSGTTPTMDIEIQESADSGTNWYSVYDFPRITATGSYNSPVLPLTGNRVRYVQTIGGTTPSFTRAINRLQASRSVTALRQMVDRTIVLTTLGSTTVNLIGQNCSNVQLVVDIGTTTIAPILQIQGSDDIGATWYSVGSTLTSVASNTVSLTVNNVNSQLYRVIVATAGTGTTANYTLLKVW